ncbi:MAG: Rieske 2Fe-2S domain-containing protein [Saprospiraceae bacterium]|nr:Rieske 2Fe-2S domain-containing protein [Saprospiraceae bacterium]
MTRKEFLGTIGIGAAFVLTASCLGSCTKDAGNAVDFILDLNDSANTALQNAGGYIVKNQVVVVKAADGNYYAATQICSHENRSKIIFRDNEYYCTDHGAKFDLNGDGLNNNGSKGISIYNTTLSGTQLRVFS